MASSMGVRKTPKVDSKAEESTTKCRSNWYRVSRSSRTVGDSTPDGVHDPMRHPGDPRRGSAREDAQPVGQGLGGQRWIRRDVPGAAQCPPVGTGDRERAGHVGQIGPAVRSGRVAEEPHALADQQGRNEPGADRGLVSGAGAEVVCGTDPGDPDPPCLVSGKSVGPDRRPNPALVAERRRREEVLGHRAGLRRRRQHGRARTRPGRLLRGRSRSRRPRHNGDLASAVCPVRPALRPDHTGRWPAEWWDL
jgi:hypothetical protein